MPKTTSLKQRDRNVVSMIPSLPLRFWKVIRPALLCKAIDDKVIPSFESRWHTTRDEIKKASDPEAVDID